MGSKEDDITKDKVWWGDINKPLSNKVFENLLKRS